MAGLNGQAPGYFGIVTFDAGVVAQAYSNINRLYAWVYHVIYSTRVCIDLSSRVYPSMAGYRSVFRSCLPGYLEEGTWVT